MSATEQIRWIQPAAGPVRAVVPVPGSKSITNRLLLLAALARGTSRISGILHSDDTDVFAQALTSLRLPAEVQLRRQRMSYRGFRRQDTRPKRPRLVRQRRHRRPFPCRRGRRRTGPLCLRRHPSDAPSSDDSPHRRPSLPRRCYPPPPGRGWPTDHRNPGYRRRSAHAGRRTGQQPVPLRPAHGRAYGQDPTGNSNRRARQPALRRYDLRPHGPLWRSGDSRRLRKVPRPSSSPLPGRRPGG